MKSWLADTGPLVALLVGNDASHAWATEQARNAPATIHTCEAVVTEALFLLERDNCFPDDLLALFDSGFLRCDFDFCAEYKSVRDLMRRYNERPMSFADACLVRLAELHDDSCIWTLDRDFQIYRRHGRATLSLVSPW